MTIKEHFEEHKTIYILGTTIVIAGFTYLIVRECHAALLRGADGLETTNASVTVHPLSFFLQVPYRKDAP